MIAPNRSFFASVLVLFLCFSEATVADTRQLLTGDQRQTLFHASNPAAQEVLRYWFEDWDQDMVRGGKGEYNEKWFPHGPDGAEGSAETDRIIREKFLETFEQATTGDLDWDVENNPFDNLAFILLMDQFSRNMFRGTDKAYAYDHLARGAVKTNINKKFYQQYFTGYQKLFLVYPLMHHEDLASQEMSLAILKAINEDPQHRYEFLNALQKGIEHYQVVFMFDRFPHRNPRRDRENTELERAYLKKEGTHGFVDGSKW